MLQKVEHIGIMVSDLDRSVAWYTTVLGLTLRERVRLNESTELAFLTIGESEIELIHKVQPPDGSPAGTADGLVNHLAFKVADVAAVLEHLRAHGVTLLDEQPKELGPLGALAAFFRGPDGEKLEIFSRT